MTPHTDLGQRRAGVDVGAGLAGVRPQVQLLAAGVTHEELDAFFENIKGKGVIDEDSFKNLLISTFNEEQMGIVQLFLQIHATHVNETADVVAKSREQMVSD